MAPATWDASALQQTPGSQQGKADAAAGAIANGGGQYPVTGQPSGPVSTQLQQVLPYSVAVWIFR